MLSSDLHRLNRFLTMVWFKCTTFIIPWSVFIIRGKKKKKNLSNSCLPNKWREDTDEQLNMRFILWKLFTSLLPPSGASSPHAWWSCSSAETKHSALIQITNSVITTLHSWTNRAFKLKSRWVLHQAAAQNINNRFSFDWDWAWIMAPTVGACSIAQLN